MVIGGTGARLPVCGTDHDRWDEGIATRVTFWIGAHSTRDLRLPMAGPHWSLLRMGALVQLCSTFGGKELNFHIGGKQFPHSISTPTMRLHKKPCK